MKYSVGQDVLHMGRRHRVIAKFGKSLVVYDLNSGDNKAFLVPEHHVAPFCEHKYEIGDPVESFNTFTGTVVGFEKETGRILCRSDKHDRRFDNERTRGGIYAYLPHEIKPREICPAFITNGQYLISFEESCGKKSHVRVLNHPNLKGCLAFYDVHTGDYLMAIDEKVTDDGIFRYGIVKHKRLC